ncbi:MAG: hypothetical protein ACI4MP_03375 [Candidatus Ventricola sp.]
MKRQIRSFIAFDLHILAEFIHLVKRIGFIQYSLCILYRLPGHTTRRSSGAGLHPGFIHP